MPKKEDQKQEWFDYRRTPEQSASMRESAERKYKYFVWKALNTPQSLRPALYALVPKYINVDKIINRVAEIEKGLTKRKLNKLFVWREK